MHRGTQGTAENPYNPLRISVVQGYGDMRDAELGACNKLTQQIIGAAIEVHRHLGPGLLESAYETCLAYELERFGLKVERQKPLPLIYTG